MNKQIVNAENSVPPLSERLQAALDTTNREAQESQVQTALQGQHPADIADAMQQLSEANAHTVFDAVDDTRAADVLDEVDGQTARSLIENAAHSARPDRISALLDRLPMDEAAEIIGEATSKQAQALLAGLTARDPADAADVRELLSYPERTAGRLMTAKFARVSPQATVAQVMDYVRRNAAMLETPYVIYALDADEKIEGVCSLREALAVAGEQPIRSLLNAAPVTVSPLTDQQEVARLISQYDLLAIPVVDAAGRMLGIVTVDDAIDVLVEEFNEDYARLVGTDAKEMERRTPSQVARLRLPWLLLTLGIELIASLVVSRFDAVLKQFILLASFMPVISAISGNVGQQAAAIMVRGLDTGTVGAANWGRAISRELLTSLLMAGVCGLILGCIGAFWAVRLTFGLVIGGAMTASMVTAGLMGSLMPMLSKRLGFDPAASAGPFETAFQDVIGFSIFLWLASVLLHRLQ